MNSFTGDGEEEEAAIRNQRRCLCDIFRTFEVFCANADLEAQFGCMAAQENRRPTTPDSQKIFFMEFLSVRFCTSTTIYWYRGAEPRQLAFSTAVGIALGVFPIFGVTVFLCAVAIAILRERCHAPTIMLANFVVTPLELSLVIPFLRLGESISGGAHFPLTKDALKLVATGQASSELLLAVLHALIGWFVASPFLFGTTYFVSFPCFKLLVQKFKPPASPKQSLDLDASDIKIKVRDL